MEVFINEVSFSNQYKTIVEFESALNFIVNTLQDLKQIKEVNECVSFTLFSAIESAVFFQSLENVREKSLKQSFYNLYYNKLNAENWRNTVDFLDADCYSWNDKPTDYNKTALAAIFERKAKIPYKPYLLINFPMSIFGQEMSLNIKKNNKKYSFNVYCCSNARAFKNWFANDYRLYVYDKKSSTHPEDIQTILRDTNRFSPVPNNKKYKGANIYKEATTGQLWYVDTLHNNGGAHLEVFSRLGDHLCEANVNGDKIPDTKDKKKKLRIK